MVIIIRNIAVHKLIVSDKSNQTLFFYHNIQQCPLKIIINIYYLLNLLALKAKGMFAYQKWKVHLQIIDFLSVILSVM